MFKRTIKNCCLYIVLLSIYLFASGIFFSGCSEDNPTQPNDPGSGNGSTLTLNSTQQGNLEYDGFRMEVQIGDVPRLQNNNPGTVTFSMNTSASVESGIPPVPSSFTVIGKYLKAGPESFIFSSPVQLFFPASSQPSPQDLTVLRYSESTGDWRIVAASAIDTAQKKIGVDLLELGYFVLAKHNVYDASDFRAGGCVYDYQDGIYNYILTVNSVTPEKPEILSLYSGGLIGGTYMGPIFLGCPTGRTKAIVPQGTLSFWVSRSNCQSQQEMIETYSIPASVTVSDPLDFTGWSTYDAVIYVPFVLPSGGSWVQGRPTNWPPATQPFGTGTVQATLTWTNTSSSAADLDLHLYGPGGLHVYYASPTSANFALDRDWQSTVGNAIENIYSTTTTVPAGDYRVDVNFYSGASKSFNCRVIVNGNVTNYSGTLSSGSVTVRTFTIQ